MNAANLLRAGLVAVMYATAAVAATTFTSTDALAAAPMVKKLAPKLNGEQ